VKEDLKAAGLIQEFITMYHQTPSRTFLEAKSTPMFI